MSKYKAIPISAAKEIAEKYEKNQVIIVTWDAVHGKEHVTTYGATKHECQQAARGAQLVQKALRWPPDQIVEVKASKQELQDALREAYNYVANSKAPEELRTRILKLLGYPEGVGPESSLLAYGRAVLEGKA